MIAKANLENIDKVVQYSEQQSLASFKLIRNNGEFHMEYKTCEDFEKQTDKDRIRKNIDESVEKSLTFNRRLKYFRKLIEENSEIIGCDLSIDYTGEKTTSTYSMATAGKAPSKDVNLQDILRNAFANKLDNTVPGLYVKRSSKKYSLVTYRELIDILK